MKNKIKKFLFQTTLAIFIAFIHLTNLLKIDPEALNDNFNIILTIFISIVISLVITNKLFKE